MDKSEFAFATVKSVKPLTIQLDGDSAIVPAISYGVTVKVKDRVEVRVRKPPSAPLINRVLAAVHSSGLVSVRGDRFAEFSVSKEVSDLDAAVTGWFMVDSSDGFAIDGSALTVDPALYPDGTLFDVKVHIGNGVVCDGPTWVITSGGIGTSYLSVPIFVSPFFTASVPVTWADSCVAAVSGGEIPLNLATHVTDTSAGTVSGPLVIQMVAAPLFDSSFS